MSETSASYLNYTNLPNGYITKCVTDDDGYNSERELYDLFFTEAYNKHGVCLDYYIASYDISMDKIWGEDQNRSFTRSFQLMGFYTLPREDRLWTKFGIEGLDQFSIYVSKRHFWDASRYESTQTSAIYDNYVPKVGDFVIANYNKYIYEIVEVKDEVAMYLQTKQHLWEFLVKPFKDGHIDVTSATSGTDIADYTNKDSDIFDISATIEDKKDDVNYSPGLGETNPNDPFGGW